VTQLRAALAADAAVAATTIVLDPSGDFGRLERTVQVSQNG
jgi:hypothetical protein